MLTKNVERFWCFFLASRFQTLLISISSLLFNLSFVYRQYQKIKLVYIILLLCLFVCLQIFANFTNDYFDEVSGVESKFRLGPKRFTLRLGSFIMHFYLSVSLLLITFILILLLLSVDYGSIKHIIFSLMSSGLFICFVYSGGPFPLASLGLGEVLVFFVFGLLQTITFNFVNIASFHFNLQNYLFSTSSGLLSAALLSVNNARDQIIDIQTLKRITLAARFGINFANFYYYSTIFLCIYLFVYYIFLHTLIYATFLTLVFISINSWKLAKDALFLDRINFQLISLGSTSLFVFIYSFFIFSTLVLL
uniref:1,4-dihydroxy-2-naphthoate octaprenyltransferase n=1 Tax=Cyanidium caldarium TaxID=2771 RepID=Q9TM11_CYACA|nr:menaquinone biosynthesis protein [Cyanidium caldarium]AAF12989.1 unknown [Cyanidium caldarium]WDB00232.1 menaquinone biosynthesis protein [Cyanidium caldarium]